MPALVAQLSDGAQAYKSHASVQPKLLLPGHAFMEVVPNLKKMSWEVWLRGCGALPSGKVELIQQLGAFGIKLEDGHLVCYTWGAETDMIPFQRGLAPTRAASAEDGDWCKLVVVFNEDDNHGESWCDVWENGELLREHSALQGRTRTPSTSLLTLLARHGQHGTNQVVDVVFDRVRVWGRALPEREVQTLWQDGTSPAGYLELVQGRSLQSIEPDKPCATGREFQGYVPDREHMTWELWIKGKGRVPPGRVELVHQAGSFGLRLHDGKLVCYLYGGEDGEKIGVELASQFSPVPGREWCQLVVVFDGEHRWVYENDSPPRHVFAPHETAFFEANLQCSQPVNVFATDGRHINFHAELRRARVWGRSLNTSEATQLVSASFDAAVLATGSLQIWPR